MTKEGLKTAKSAKKDEFYTQYEDIEVEMNAYLDFNPDVFRGKSILLPCDDPEWSNFTKYFAQNFERLGIKKLVSTSYARRSQSSLIHEQPTLFEIESPLYDQERSFENGRIFKLDHDANGDKKVNVDDLKWEYLAGDGDFRSAEVKRLRDEADVVVTNPPFSLFREFLAWLLAGKKQFSIIGNMNAISYKDVFPMMRANELWLGESIHSGDREFEVPKSYSLDAAGCREDSDGRRFIRVKGVRWFTNIDHGRRHKPIPLMTKSDNLKFSKHKEVRDIGYKTYENYDALEIPYTDAIPSDYDGVMGVPISFMDKYSPDQFVILGMAASSYDKQMMGIPFKGQKDGRPIVDGKNTYARIFIKKKDYEG